MGIMLGLVGARGGEWSRHNKSRSLEDALLHIFRILYVTYHLINTIGGFFRYVFMTCTVQLEVARSPRNTLINLSFPPST